MIGLTGLLVFVVLKNLGEEKRLIEVIKQAKLRWFFVAFLLQMIYYWLYSVLWHKALRQYGIKWRVLSVLCLLI